MVDGNKGYLQVWCSSFEMLNLNNEGVGMGRDMMKEEKSEIIDEECERRVSQGCKQVKARGGQSYLKWIRV